MHKIGKPVLAIVSLLIVAAGAYVFFSPPTKIFAFSLRVSGAGEGFRVEGDAPVFAADNLAPGDTCFSTVTVFNDSDFPFSYCLSSALETGEEEFYGLLQLTISGPEADEYYSGPLSELLDIRIEAVPAHDRQILNLAVHFPQSIGSNFQGKSLTTAFIFSAVHHVPYEITVSASPAAGGEVTGGGTYVYPAGDIKVLAKPNPGYVLAYWWDGAKIVGKDETLNLYLEDFDEGVGPPELVAYFWAVEDGTEVKAFSFGSEAEAELEFDSGVRIRLGNGHPDEEVILGVTRYGNSDLGVPAGYQGLGIYLRIDRSENLPGKPARIEVSYNLPLPKDIKESSLRLYRYNPAARRWDALAGGVDTERRVVWADVDNFSTLGVFGAVPAPVQPEPSDLVERIGGADRYQTAVRVCQNGWEQADTVVLARGDDFADALAGATLAFSLDAPILLTPPNRLDSSTRQEVLRLQAGKVVIIGGFEAVSLGVENELTKLGLAVERLSGATRFDTAAMVSKRAAPAGASAAFLAFGYDFPDALAASAYAAVNNFPILLTGKDGLPAATVTELNRLARLKSEFKVVVVGGAAVIHDTVLAQLPRAERIEGANRYLTALELARRFNPAAVYIATGLDFPDSLSGAVLAAHNKGGILLVSKSLNAEVGGFISALGVNPIVVFGGEEAVSPELYAALLALLQ